MRDKPFDLPLRAPGRGVTLAGLRLAWGIGVVLLTALRLLLVVLLRLLRSFLMLPLLLVMVGGIGAAAVFAWGHHWLDVAEATALAIGCAVLLVIYSQAAVWLDPNHFAPRPVPNWRRYV